MAPSDGEAKPARPPIGEQWWAPGLLALVIASAFVGALLVRADGDASLLVHAAPPWTDPATARPSLTVQDPDEGFDGQFFYRLGTDPWSNDDEVAGVTFDLPSLRNARWGYGALAWMASGGDPDQVPEALIGLNLAAAFAVGAAGGALVSRYGHPRWWGAAIILWPGFAYSLSMDTSELVASAFLLGALVAAQSRRWALATAAMTAAVLTRDTTVVVAVGFVLAAAWTWWRTWPSREPHLDGEHVRWTGWAWIGGVPLVAFVGWQGLQRARFGTLALTSSGDSNLAAPLGGLIELVRTTALPTTSAELLRVASAALVVATIASAGWAWRRSATPLPERLAWIPAVGVVLVLNAYLWSGATAFMRATTEAAILSIVILLGLRDRRIVAAAGTSLGLVWVATAAAQLSKLG